MSYSEELLSCIVTLEKAVNSDPNAFAFDSMSFWQESCNEYYAVRRFLSVHGLLSCEDSVEIREHLSAVQEKLKELHQKRLLWHAKRLDENLKFKRSDANKNETALIMANVYNDIFRSTDFHG